VAYGVAEHGDETEGGFNAFLAARAAAIGAATAPAAENLPVGEAGGGRRC